LICIQFINLKTLFIQLNKHALVPQEILQTRIFSEFQMFHLFSVPRERRAQYGRWLWFLAVSSENSDTVDLAVFCENKRRINNIST